MADTKVTALTENTAPLGSDLLYWVDDPAGTPASNKIYAGSMNMLPDGYMINGKLSVTVTSSNLTVALKTKNGTDPSATDPVSVWINGTYRRVTTALSVTKNAGTDWAALGSQLPATESDLFVYLIWNTGPVTDIVDIAFARVPYGRVYSDFSATTTNYKYLAYGNASAPASTDDLVCVGRFAATLSAGVGFTWSVPTFTNTNLVQTPINATRWLTWTPTLVGFSANPTNTNYRYKIVDSICYIDFTQNTNGTSNATTFTATLPITAATVTNAYWGNVCAAGAVDNTVVLSGTANGYVASAGTVITFQKDMSGTAWTAAGGKRALVSLWYEV